MPSQAGTPAAEECLQVGLSQLGARAGVGLLQPSQHALAGQGQPSQVGLVSTAMVRASMVSTAMVRASMVSTAMVRTWTGELFLNVLGF